MIHELFIILRSLRHRLGFTLVVIFTLGLGIGVNAGIFGIVDAVILRPLPYPESDRLVSVFELALGEQQSRRTLSYPDYEAIRDEVGAFASVAAHHGETLTYSDGEQAELWRGARVSPSYFPTLGVKPLLGRGLSEPSSTENAEGEAPAPSHELVLGYDLWQRVFSGDAEVLGRRVVLGDVPHTVVGVMPRGFRGLYDNARLWVSLADLPLEQREERTDRYLGGVARLAEGVGLEQANSQLEALFAHLAEEYAESGTGYSAMAQGLHRDLLGDLRRPALLLLTAVALLLAIACVNVAHMLLAQGRRRQRQAAVRVALGARPSDLLRWTTLEATVLGLGGGGVGLLLASWGLSAFEMFALIDLPTHAMPTVDSRVVLFTLALSVSLGVMLGLPQAWSNASRPVASRLRTRQGGGGAGRGFGGRLLLASEVALALLLTLGAALTALDWQRLLAIDPGFSSQRSAVFRLALPEDREQHPALRARVLEQVTALPGVEQVALASDLPLDGSYSATVISPHGAVRDPAANYGGGHRVYQHRVSEDYFSALGIPLRRGRIFGPEDHAEAERVAVVSERLATRLWPGQDPLGARFHPGPPRDGAPEEGEEEPRWFTVIGVVDEVRHRDLTTAPGESDPDLYLALAQLGDEVLSGVVTTHGQPTDLLPTLRSALEGLHPEMPVFGLTTLADYQAGYSSRSQLSSVSMAFFALLALVMAAVGIYGVVTQQVDERTREIGIRMALGAQRQQVLGEVMRHAMSVVAAGLVAGGLVSLVFARWLDGRLFELEVADPRVVALAVAILGTVAFLACLVPARRASRVDPLVSLRDE